MTDRAIADTLSRRRFLKTAAACLGIMSAPAWAASILSPNERRLSLYNNHTGESLSTLYWQDGRYLTESITEFNRILRDHRTNQTAPMDIRLFDMMHVLHRNLDGKKPFHIISGYRSPASNSMLASRSRGVAKSSLHMKAQAIDIQLPGRELADLRQAAIALGAGGVGYYPASNFVHIDTGRVRAW